MGTIGEAGTYTGNYTPADVEIEIFFERELTNPVIHLTGTNAGGDQYTLRVVEVRDDGFKFVVDEWEYLDGPHPAVETIHWIAIEAGEHQLPDGRLIKAGYTSATDSTGDVTFASAFTGSPPVVLTTTASNNDPTAVDSDPLNITANGFDVRLQEEEAQDGIHIAETVGWIAASLVSKAGG